MLSARLGGLAGQLIKEAKAHSGLKTLLKKTEKDMESDEKGKSKPSSSAKKSTHKAPYKHKVHEVTRGSTGKPPFPIGDSSGDPKNPGAGVFDRDEGKQGMDLISALAVRAGELPYVEKLASDAELRPDEVYQMASVVNMPVTRFVKQAYADVDDFIDCLKVFRGVPIEKRGGVLAQKILERLRDVGGSMAGGAKNIGKAMVSTPKRRNLTTGFGTATALGLASIPIARSLAKSAPQAGPTEQSIDNMTGGTDPAAQAASEPQLPQAPQGSGTAAAGSSGMSPLIKTLLLGGGAVGLGGGAAMLANRKKKKKEAVAADSRNLAVSVIKKAALNKVAGDLRKNAARILLAHLDKVAGFMPLEKQAQVRVLQSAVASGKPLSVAIKVAYPRLSGEQRGILAGKLCREALCLLT
jgi:hypothetical protein